MTDLMEHVESLYRRMIMCATTFLLVGMACGALRWGGTTRHPRTENKSMAYNVIIAGGREFTNYELLAERCEHYLGKRSDVTIISGAARGADQMGERFALEHKLPLVRMPADWEQHGKKAGYLRNAAMAENAHALIAFWNGTSKGTAHMIELARSKGLAVRVVRV